MPNQTVCGVDIGGTKTAIVLSSRPPIIDERIVFPTNSAEDPSGAIERIKASIHTALSAQGLFISDLRAIGVSCGSPLDLKNGIIKQPPNLPTWKDVPIKAILEAEFSCNSFLENDANAGALAEFRFGAAQGMRNMIFLTMGTGLGAGLILNGSLYRGASQLAGEIGHVRLTDSGPMGHNKAGAVEGWASGAGMARAGGDAVRDAVANGKTTVLATHNGNGAPLLSARSIWEAAQAGDSLAMGVVSATGVRLGQAMAILIDVLNPECIVVGGVALRMGESLLGPARSEVMRECLPTSAQACRIVPAGLGEQVGDVAAICVALEGLNGGQ
jgi:glucokinase